MIRTSRTDPLKIDEVAVDGTAGRIGLTFCPGKVQKSALSGPWERDLKEDLEVVRSWGAASWVNLLTGDEMARLGVGDMKDVVERLGGGIRYFHLPIEDTRVPDPRFEERWEDAGREIRDALISGGKVLFHCKGGLGRTGTIAARLLVELGADPEDAIRRVRHARPGAIENDLQESHVRSVRRLRNTFRGMEIPVPAELPKLVVTERSTSGEGEWFPVPGMCGGFSYRIELERELCLIAESWCRVAGGSGQRHAITTNEVRLLEEGFV